MPFVANQELSERQREEETGTRLRRAIDRSMEGLAILDRNGAYRYVNSSHAVLYGYTVEELMGKPWKVLYDEDVAAVIETEYFPVLVGQGR